MTRDPDSAAEKPSAASGDDPELAALEAAAEQARGDARRAAQAVRLARRARAGRVGAAPAPVADEPVDELVEELVEDPVEEPVEDASVEERVAPVALTKPAAPAVVDADEDEDSADEDDDSDEDADEESDDDEDRTPRRRPRLVTVLTTLFAVLAAAFVVIAFVVHQDAADSRGTSPAAARDAALLAARQDIAVLNTLDYKNVDGGLQLWLDATTGTLHDQLSQVSDADKQAIAVSKAVTTASVLAAAVTQVDASAGSATVIASVQTVVTPATGAATTKRTRFSLTMARVGDVWKIGAVQQVPVTVT